MIIREVQSSKQWKIFHQVPKVVYKDDASHILHIEKDVESIFDPQSNPRFANGEARLWVAQDETGTPIGRIAAFIDHEKNSHAEIKTGGLGFFECIEDARVAKDLLDAASEYLQSFDIDAIEGPINFGERDKFYGLQTYGYEHKLFQDNYNPKYYEQFFQDFGFSPFLQQLTFRFFSSELDVVKYRRITEIVKKRNNVTVEYPNPNNYMKVAEDIAEIYNEAFKDYEHYKEVEPKTIFKMIQDAKMIMDPKLISIAYIDKEPVSVVAAIPNIAPFTKPLKGKFDMWRIPVFLYHKWKEKRPDVKGILSGVKAKYQNKGVFACVLINIMTDWHIEKYRSGYMPSIMGHNDSMINTLLNFGAHVAREHIVYRKMLSDLPLNAFKFKEFERK